jgi:hypothetical protein
MRADWGKVHNELSHQNMRILFLALLMKDVGTKRNERVA